MVGGLHMIFEYNPSGVCSKHYTIDIDENDVIKSVEIIGGCQGNLTGISKIIVGMNIDHVIERFSGINCGFKGTSCPDQISQALQAYKLQRSKHD